MKNELPIAVHVASGGDARVRTGGTAISLDGVGSGSFQVQNASRYRLIVSTRTAPSLFVLVSYSDPAGLSNAAHILGDMQVIVDDVPEGTTVYFSLIGGMDLLPTQGGTNDYLYITTYG